MSVKSDEITEKVKAVLNVPWNITAGRVVPGTDDITMRDGAVTLDAVYLYADLKESTKLVKRYKPEFAARIIRTFLVGACEAIKANGGEIRSFDGDRVMAIFIGEDRYSKAVKTSLNINWVVDQCINPLIKTTYPNAENVWQVGHVVGIDAGKAFIVRGGVRIHSDLVSIGEAPNIAAKLSGVRDGYNPTLMTDRVYDNLSELDRVGGKDREQMFAGPIVRDLGTHSVKTYRSGWMKTP